MTTITPLPPPPSRSDPANFASKGDALLGALPTFVTETNTVAGEVNTNATTATTQAGIATTQAGIATTQAGIATTQANAAASDAANTAVLLANAGSMLGINFGAFSMVDNELIVTHLSTTTPSVVNGDLILDYETL